MKTIKDRIINFTIPVDWVICVLIMHAISGNLSETGSLATRHFGMD